MDVAAAPVLTHMAHLATKAMGQQQQWRGWEPATLVAVLDGLASAKVGGCLGWCPCMWVPGMAAV